MSSRKPSASEEDTSEALGFLFTMYVSGVNR